MTTDQSELEEFEQGDVDDPVWAEEKFVNLMDSMRNGLYKKKDFYGRGNQIVKMGELFASEFITNQEKMDRLELSEKELGKHGLQKGDLLFARRSYVREGSGKCSIVDDLKEPLVPESSIIRARPDREQILPKFVYYFFKSSLGRNEMSKIVRQTAVSGIAQSDLKEIKIPVPPKKSQENIVECLRLLDEKIVVNNQISSVLEDIVQTLFTNQFINYQPYDEFQETPLGRIPEDFEIIQFSDVCSTRGGGTPSTDEEEYWGGNNLWLTPKEVTSLDTKIVFDTERKITDEGLNNSSTKIMPEKSVLLTSRATVGEVVVNREPMGTNQGFICIQPNERVEPYFLSCVVESKRKEIENRASGSTYDEISQTSFNEIEFAAPPKEDILRFESRVEDIYEEIYTRELENRKLKSLRDTLLPKLMSGEVRVNDINLGDLEVTSEV